MIIALPLLLRPAGTAAEVESIELYVPKLRIYNGTQLVKSASLNLRHAFRQQHHNPCPLLRDTPGYPRNLRSILHAWAGHTFGSCRKASCLLKTRLRVVVLHPGKITGDRDDCFRHMVKISGSLQ